MTTETPDYGHTIHLPKTDFPRRAGLVEKEPQILARWEKMDLYQRQREASKGRENFILHDGPPYANGDIHMGHAVNKILKDVINKYWQALGYNTPYVPGWDCHGLPIEWKIEEKYRAAGKDKDAVDALTFRAECRAFAQHWVDVQAGEFKRLGVTGDWKNPYLTMTKAAEASIVREIHKVLQNGLLYKGAKPVMWSVVEKTALAEAEVEYQEHKSLTVWVKFPLQSGPAELAGAHIVIWTTTPWTIPANRAIAFGGNIDYVGFEVAEAAEGAQAKAGDKVVVASALLEQVLKDAKVTAHNVFWQGKGDAFTGALCHHPLHGLGYDFDVPMLAGEHVTTDAGTGFVHTAPGHGHDDWVLIMNYNAGREADKRIPIESAVDDNGVYTEKHPHFAGMDVFTQKGEMGTANVGVIKALVAAERLFAKGSVRHEYPHSWRSKAPLIHRVTPQWFIGMDDKAAGSDVTLRQQALKAIGDTRWVPAMGENRIRAMIEQRPDWCISRQRSWGVPIALFLDRKTGQPLKDPAVDKRIYDAFAADGSDAWWSRNPQEFLGNDHNAEDYAQVFDIVDVWFESGATHAFVLEDRPELQSPADLYLEGSDQHRGWFHSSLLESCATRARAPYKAVLTHGFVLDEKGYKMSKSLGNVVDPQKLVDEYGADIVRLWTMLCDYAQDIRIGQNTLKTTADIYRRIRGTFCYLLGSLDGTGDGVKAEDLSGLDKYILHRLWEIDAEVRRNIQEYNFQNMVTVVHNFCARELSAFYFDICKDTLYCEAVSSQKRRAVVHVLDRVFTHLCHWLAPVLTFTCEEAWLSYKGLALDDMKESIHLSVMPKADDAWRNDALAAEWDKIAAARGVVTGALEVKRAEKAMGASLEAAPHVYVADAALLGLLQKSGFADVCITSGIALHAGAAPEGAFTAAGAEGVAVVFAKAEGEKCLRCWKYTTDTGAVAAHPHLCKRCGEAVEADPRAAAA
ncbi:MAG: isoleucine--tRNA ligase [Alphaproteobacteria bacterium]|nr:isoleucine--tRNA ligase [Alphaproteobacteria bacterium]